MSSQMMMVVSYTIFSAILIGETLLLGWESWAILLIVGGVGASWFMHINRIANSRTRLWIVSLLMMATYFFYGSHVTSTYDLAIIMAAVILLFIMTGMHALITLCQITYYITMTYAVILLFLLGEKFDSLVISRTLMHYAVVTMLCWIARIIIKKWNEVLGHSREEINILTAATKRLNDFLANASHEIRTPINAILGLCDMGLDKETDGEKRGRLLSIEEAGKRMGEQISDILDYSEIDRGDLTNNNEDYMLSSVINDIVKLFLMREIVGFPISLFMKEVILKVLPVVVITLLVTFLVWKLVPAGGWRLLAVLFTGTVSTCITTYSFALTEGERAFVRSKLRFLSR